MSIDIFNTSSEPWMSHPDRNCADITRADEWFPASGTHAKARDAYANQLCQGCPSSVACLTYALERPELEGIWGGTTEAERDQMRRGGAA